MLIVGGFVFALSRKKEYGVAIGAGIGVHLILDMLFAPGILLLWPSSLFVSFLGVERGVELVPFFVDDAGLMISRMKWAVADLGLGVFWLAYLWWQKKLRF